MGAEFERLGYNAGVKTANECRKEIRRAHVDDLPTLAGTKLQIVVRESKNPIYEQISWQTGFFSGFLDRCQELRS